MVSESQRVSAVLAGPELRASILEMIRRHLDLSRYRVFLFGSESGGRARRESDIDVGILGDEPVAGSTMERIRADLETLRTLRRFDVVDFFFADASFRTTALKDAEAL